MVFLIVGGPAPSPTCTASCSPATSSRSTTTPWPTSGGSNKTTLSVALAPVRKPLSFTPGQFVFLALGGTGGWERHPFSVSSAPSDPRLELTIKASGDYTRELYDQLQPGVPAKLAGPFGGFDYRQGGHDQIWIAGGIGVTPFLSWIRSIDGQFDRGSTSITRSRTPMTRSTSTRFGAWPTGSRRCASISSAPTPTAC